MSLEESNTPPSAPKWQRLPLPVRMQLRQVIRDHLTRHGSAHYEAVRDDPRFSRWFGTHLGYRGEKRFDRMVRDVRAHRATGASRSPTPAPARTRDGAGDDVRREILSHEAEVIVPGVISYSELQDTLRRQRMSLERAVGDCFNDDGVLTEPKLHAQLSRELRAVVRESQGLTRQSIENANSQAFVVRLTKRLFHLAAGRPEQLAALREAVNDAMQDQSGLTATSSIR